MNKLAKKNSKLLKFLSNFSIAIGFIGMIFILFTLFQGIYKLIFVPNAAPVVAPVLPGVSISPNLPVLSFWHWVITIFIVAVVHEFAHGVYARLYNLKIKSSGFAFLGPILAAFVEPDEKLMKKISIKKQLAIISAGPFINIILGFLFVLFLSFIFIPLQSNLLTVNGLNVLSVEQGSPASLAGLSSGLILKEINNIKISSDKQLIEEIQKTKQNEVIKLTTDKGDYYVTPNFIDNKPRIGVSVKNNIDVILGLPKFLLPLLLWLNLLIYWLGLISLGIGLFNLLPLGPIDGGRMLHAALLSFMNEKKASNIFKVMTFISLSLIIINLLPWLFKLFKFIFGFLF